MIENINKYIDPYPYAAYVSDELKNACVGSNEVMTNFYADAIEKKEILKIVKLDNSGISVRIGQENEIKALQDCTVITVPYESNNGHKGAISIFGPTRMEYSKIIPLLEYIAKNIKNIM